MSKKDKKNKNKNTPTPEAVLPPKPIPVEEYPPRYPEVLTVAFKGGNGDLHIEVNTTFRKKHNGIWMLFPGRLNFSILREHVSEVVIAQQTSKFVAQYINSFEETYLDSINNEAVVEDPNQED